jgi:hypothetical protein
MRLPILTACALVLSACAAHGTRELRDPTPSRDSELLTAEELSGVTGSTVYDAVRQLRPAWIMRSRPTAMLQRNQGDVIIYVDGTRYGAGVDGLRTLRLRAAASVRYFSPGSAEARFGPGHLLGAIEVITVPR